MTSKEKSTNSKRSSSLSWRLSLSQVGQLIGSYLKIDLLLVVLFFISMIVWSEIKAEEIYQQYLDEPTSTIEEIMLDPQQFQVSQQHNGEGIELHFLPNNKNDSTGSFRQFGFADAHTAIGKEEDFPNRFPYYTVYIPTVDNQAYWKIMVFWELPVLFLLVGIIIVLVFQLLSLPFAALRARNRSRRLLQPIYELTATAQTISSVSDFSVPLSGTIDALNTITGSHFDRRITIADEREELQGLAQAINDMLDRLDAAYQAQLRFVSDASHELRTPISIIQGYARLLSRWGKDDPKTLQESVDAIQQEAEGMQTLVEQLLFLARSDNQSIQLHRKEFDVSETLGEVVRETLLLSETHHVVEQIPSHIFLVADEQLIKQAVRILVDNSLKYTDPENGRITITLTDSPEQVEIQVGDNGIGIPPDQLENLFSRFWRADESRTRKTGGTGLGLSIAYWIIESHGGYISVVSRENVGTKFTMTLPKLLDYPVVKEEV